MEEVGVEITEIEGSFTLSDGSAVSFRIGDVGGSLSWQQWGGSREAQFRCVELIEALSLAAADRLDIHAGGEGG